MADSQTEPGPGKRERLVSSAREVIHQQGVEKTTIADMAKAADVPVGNVYYLSLIHISEPTRRS